MISRRCFVIAGGAFLCARPSQGQTADKPSLLSVPPGKALGFAVVRKGSKIGEHLLTFEQSGEGNLIVHVAVQLRVGIGPIALFRYTHNATETWKNGQLVSLETQTSDDGKPFKVSGNRTGAGFVVEGTKAPLYTAPGNALPATHWNHKQLDSPWINTQDGRLMHPTITPMGKDTIPTASGAKITANHFSLTGDAVLDTWYDDTANWSGLSFKAGDGSDVVYERI